MEKKQKERRILALVYDENNYAEIIEDEKPDFYLRHHGHDKFFGVEITEFYYSQSNARLANIPYYFDEIVKKGNYRHRKDKDILQAVEFDIVSPEGQIQKHVTGIFQENPPLDNYVNMIADVISDKDTKYQEYNSDLSHVNLIVFDAERGLVTAPVEDFCKYFLTERMRNALYATKFHEIYLVTILDKNQKVYMPLKMLLLLADFHVFLKLILDYPWEVSDEVTDDKGLEGDLEDSQDEHNIHKKLTVMFYHYLATKTKMAKYTEKVIGDPQVIWGNSSIGFGEEQKKVFNYNDYLIVSDEEIEEDLSLTNLFLSDKFRESEKIILKDHVFIAEFKFQVKGEFPL